MNIFQMESNFIKISQIKKFWDILNKDYRRFKSLLKDADEACVAFDTNQWESLFLYSIVKDGVSIKVVKEKLIKGGIHEKTINECFYNILKARRKIELGQWSWNEIEEYDIAEENIKKTSTKFCFI